MNPWRWLFGAKVQVLRLRPGDVVVLESPRPLSHAQAVAVREAWEQRFPHIPAAVVSELRLGGVVRDPTLVPPTPPGPRVREPYRRIVTKGGKQPPVPPPPATAVRHPPTPPVPPPKRPPSTQESIE